jgi:hypothetical protein
MPVLAGILLFAALAAGAEETAAPGAGGLPAPAEPDTVRTNLWLTEALMGEIVSVAAATLPPGPHALKLVDQGGSQGDELFGGVAAKVLREQGHELFVAGQDSTAVPEVDYVFGYRVIGVDLAYPEVGRTLGIWQRWVARDLEVSASVEVAAASSGQLLFKDVVSRRINDRVDSGDFDDVGSDLYEFTNAEKSGSGWKNRMEEIIVLGTLVGLIAVYFANTGN